MHLLLIIAGLMAVLLMATLAIANLKLREWVLTSNSGELLKVPSAAYVLSGNTLTGDYPLKIQADGPLKLKAITDRGSFSADVTR